MMAELHFGHPNSIVLQEFPGQATDHRSFLRRARAVDHETV
ncbi:hypothetical protein LINPERPRIM_LOCUS26157 [Linum perenne]